MYQPYPSSYLSTKLTAFLCVPFTCMPCLHAASCAVPYTTQGAAAAMYQQYQQAALNGYGDPDQDYLMDDEGADLTPRSGGGRACGGRSRRATAGRSSAAVNAAAAASAAAAAGGPISYQRSGIPGKVCCECGATQTPQWREGPKGTAKGLLRHGGL
jgi:hypothetical protein